MNELDGHEEGRLIPYTGDGSVDCYGNPAIKNKTGGWRSALLLLGIHLHIPLAELYTLIF